MTGNAGLKLTKERWSTEGIVPLSFTFDTPGILARSMADAAFGLPRLIRSSEMPPLSCAAFRRALTGSASALPTRGSGTGARMASMRSSAPRWHRSASAGAVLKDVALPEAQEAFAVLFVEGGVSAIELRVSSIASCRTGSPTIDPVNVPALKNAENLSAREYLTRRLRLLDAGQARRHAFSTRSTSSPPRP